jgi:hypothetical protein
VLPSAWCDAQGSETDVIESGASIWRSGARLWTEVWPAGLERHGGIKRFDAAVRNHFASFVG